MRNLARGDKLILDEASITTMPPALKNQKSAVRFVVIDDSASFRELIRDALMRRFPRAEVRDFSLGREGLEACLRDPPDLLVVDLYLYDIDGRDIVREIRRQGVPLRVVAVTAHPDAQLPADLLSLGVAGFVDKHSPMEQVERAAQRVLEGGMFFSASIRPPVPAHAEEPTLPSVGAEALTVREQEVVRLVVRGLLSKEIGSRLGLSTRTVEKHRARILAKLGLHDIPTLVRWCLRNGLS